MWSFLWIAIFVINDPFHPTDAVILRCYKGSLHNYEDTNIDSAEVHITSGCINTELTTAIFVHGYNGNAESDTAQAMMTALMSYRTTLNAIILDWSDKSTTPNNTDSAEYYRDKAMPAAVSIGKQLGKVLVKLTELKLNLMNTVLIGFSLGCHLVGYAGREVKNLGKELWLIYGVDPANPFFNNPSPQYKSLSKTCAKYVLCSHFDPGYLGTRKSDCLSDVWVNYGNFIHGNQVQPGCPKRTIMSSCSHERAPMVVADAMKHPGTLMASAAPDYSTWAKEGGTGTNIIDIGDFQNTTCAVGNYYITTKGAEPYGEGKHGLKPDN